MALYLPPGQTENLPIWNETVAAFGNPRYPEPLHSPPQRRPDLWRHVWWGIATVLLAVGLLLIAGAA